MENKHFQRIYFYLLIPETKNGSNKDLGFVSGGIISSLEFINVILTS